MSTITMKQTTSSTPEQIIAGLTDFGPGRSQLFPNSADAELTVHYRGVDDWADVTEGGRGTWERLYYDWSDPGRVVLETTDSNVWGGSSGHAYTFTRNPDGTTDVELVTVREGKNPKGRLLEILLATFGKRVLVDAFDHSIKAIEDRCAARMASAS